MGGGGANPSSRAIKFAIKFNIRLTLIHAHGR